MISNDYGLADRQKELLLVLKDVDEIMMENSIEYSLCGGTLIGAIRHNGFIPWDDDLDIMYDRENFIKLLKLFNKNNGVLVARDSSTEYVLRRILWVYRIQKKGDDREGLHAANVDLMVMDNCPDNSLVRKVKVLLIKLLQGMMHKKLELSDKSSVMKFCLISTYVFGRLFSDDFKYLLYDRISQISNDKNTEYVTGYNDLFKTLNCRYKGCLMKKIIRHPFENLMLPITAEYDDYLTVQYGDYMTPPSNEERAPIHIV